VNDTIAAVATPPGEGAIALVRISGPEAVAVAQRVFAGRTKLDALRPRMLYRGKIVDGEVALDDVLLAVFRAPASYTGEDVVEITCHGGVLVTRRILEAVLRSGARAAEPGEFTQRAFLNGKLELTQAEAVMDLISAQSDLALRAAHEQLEGRIGEEARAQQEAILTVLAHVEAYIDFPDEDINPDTTTELIAQLEAIRERIASLLGTAKRGRMLRDGVRTVIYGEPNVGKSSLLNLLLGRDRAIVSELPGTTRDTIEEVIDVRGIPLRIVDTAGIRSSDDPIEKEGMARTERSVADADLVLRVVDASQPAGVEPDARTLLVLNKIDLGEHPSWRGRAGIRISCTAGTGIGELEEAIAGRILDEGPGARQLTVAINTRHQACLEKAERYCAAAQEALRNEIAPEFVAVEIRALLDAIGEIVGKLDTEDLLTRIFSTFCIGK
jgi:tRNA modification GTPase